MKFPQNSFNLAGTDEVFTQMLDKAISERTSSGFHYLEIGIATGATLATVADHLRAHTYVWRATGIDLCNGEYFNAREFIKWTLSHDTTIEFRGGNGVKAFVNHELKNDIRILLLKSPDVRALSAPQSVNFAVIDGCHGAACVTKDFVSIEDSILAGGIVAFHDAGEEEDGTMLQSHCGEPIKVRAALNNLFLWSPAANPIIPGEHRCVRPNWKQIGFAQGDRLNNGHSFMFFQKQLVPVEQPKEGFHG